MGILGNFWKISELYKLHAELQTFYHFCTVKFEKFEICVVPIFRLIWSILLHSQNEKISLFMFYVC